MIIYNNVLISFYVCHFSSLSSQFMVGYEDSQLGAPEEEEEEQEVEQSAADVRSGGRREGGAMERSDYDKLLLESAVEEFEKNFADQLQE